MNFQLFKTVFTFIISSVLYSIWYIVGKIKSEITDVF